MGALYRDTRVQIYIHQVSPSPSTIMKVLLEHGLQLVLRNPPGRNTRLYSGTKAKRNLSQTLNPWVCRGCLVRQHHWKDWISREEYPQLRRQQHGNSSFSTSVRRTEISKPNSETTTTTENANPTSRVRENLIKSSSSSSSLESPDQSSTLPSQTEKQRWQMSKRMAQMMDRLLARASIASQQINVYTGTDYSGIEALRKEIIDLEQKVREDHRAVDDARTHHRDAYAKQTSAQKEIVALLERKSSWSPGDLERYMSLVRAEHTDEQAVQIAKDSLKDTERTLEESRSLLERLERKQYHEEQIWSDTIRRNSTWVTFGLMGVNIVLLLAQIAIFEPYRRRKIVRDVQKALDEKTLHAPSFEVQRGVDEVVEPRGVAVEQLENADMIVNKEKPSLSSIEQVSSGSAPTSTPLTDAQAAQAIRSTTWSDRWQRCRGEFYDLFSDRVVQMRKVDVTNLALQGTTIGFVVATSVLLVLQRR